MATQLNTQTNDANLPPVSGATGDEMQSAVEPKAEKGKKNEGTVTNLFTVESQKRNAALALKFEEQKAARELLKEAVKLDRAGGNSQSKAAEIAGEAGMILYHSLRKQRMDRDELTSILGEYYGYRLKGDASTMVKAGDKAASKTPFGRGEEIRKRAFRLLRAAEYAETGEGDRFFEGDETAKVPPLPKDDVAALVASADEGKIGFWYSYEAFAEMRRKANEGRETSPAFNIKTLNAIRSGLAEDINVARDLITSDPVLLQTYVALQDNLNLIWQASPTRS
jgi:hypothetical protein